ncbi:sensor domain-containing protein, partial [Candidatus Darwinibacter acetoxidans]
MVEGHFIAEQTCKEKTYRKQQGVPLPTPAYRPTQPGMMGWVRTMTDPRAWLDFVFESLIAFPLRTFTFVVGVSWWAGALGGLTYVLW